MNPERPQSNEVSREDLVAFLSRRKEEIAQTDIPPGQKGMELLESAEGKMMLLKWKQAQLEKMPEIDMRIVLASICEEAGLTSEAIEQYQNALDYGQANRDLGKAVEISENIARLSVKEDMEENEEHEKERTRIVGFLREKGFEDKDVISRIERWKGWRYKKLSSGVESIPAQITLIIEQGNICKEAGFVDAAVDQFLDALMYAEMQGDLEKEEEIKTRILEVNPDYKFPPKQ